MRRSLVVGLITLLLGGLVLVSCSDGSDDSDTKGTFRIRITGIPAEVMQAGTRGDTLIGLYYANKLKGASISLPQLQALISSQPLGGRQPGTSDQPYPDVTDYTGQSTGFFYYEFYMWVPQGGALYEGTKGNYDIGFARKLSPGGISSPSDIEVKALINRPLKINTVNTFAYTDFVQKVITN